MGHALDRALDGVTLQVGRGEIIGLLETSGSGKSTLLNLIARLDPIQALRHDCKTRARRSKCAKP